MYDIVFLTDIFFGESSTKPFSKRHIGNSDRIKELDRWSFWSRYLGPYAVAQSVRDQLPEKKIKVIDYFTRIPNFFEYLSPMVDENTQYVCISTTFLQNVFNSRVSDFNMWFTDHKDLLLWFEKLKAIAPNCEIVLGGHACDTFYWSYCVQSPTKPLPEAFRKYVKHVFHGYGEDQFVEFLKGEVPESNRKTRDGIHFYNDNRKPGNGTKVLPVRWSKEEAVQANEWLPLEISKGCKFGCKFCMFDRLGTTVKEEEALRSEFLYNYENFGTTGYLFTDDTINDSMKKVETIHRVVKSLPFDIEWVSYARPDTFYKKPEMIELLLDSGCRGLFLGLETFSPEAAKIAGKGLHPDKVKQIIEEIRARAGNEIFILGSFIIGLVGETEQSLSETLDYLVKQKVIDKISFEVLYVRPPEYRTSIDNDFSNNPKKFGFKKIQSNPYDWEHETLDYNTCCKIKSEWKRTLDQYSYSGAESGIEGFTNFWSYPRIRSLGYSHSQASDFLRKREIPDELYEKNKQWIANYHRALGPDSLVSKPSRQPTL